MSEGEHTIITKIPRERLNQIASRKLAALSIPVRLGADRETLEGEIAFASLRHPATDQPVPRGRFAISGHDHLRFLDPPLAALGLVPFYDLSRAAVLEQRVAALLRDRMAALRGVADRLSALRLEVTVDPARLVARAVVRTPGHAFELLGGPEGVRVARVAPVGSTPFEVAPNFPQLRLDAMHTLASLEAQLEASLPAMQLAQAPQRPAAAGGAAASTSVEAMPAPRTAVTLAGLAEVFGGDVALAPGSDIELIQEFRHAGTRYRFVATREVGATFKGRLIGPGGDVWSERFELAGFPGISRTVAAALGTAEPADALGEVAGAQAAGGRTPARLGPRAGEVWVMNVVVEQWSGDEVRYVGTDIDGHPYGAARVLKRAEFEAVFTQDGGGWRLLVQIEQVQGDQVVYRQLDRQRQPIGSPRRLPAGILAANFVPEAAAP